MKKLLFILITGLALQGFTATAATVSGVAIPDTLSLPNSGPTLVLNGAGLREKFFKDIYVGALYLPSRSTDAGAILSDSGPASVLLHFVYGDISKDKITKGWVEGLEKNVSAAEMKQFEKKLADFNNLFQTVRKGDIIRIDYLPGSGTQVRINGKWRGAVEGNDFFRAVLSIWLGDKPVTRPLRDGMLGISR